ncbi:MAG: sugar phosphate isomerase/epimerase [Anaerolineae bacterium]|nr:sugar phosphate isomerase/epimerase [Anaerolineae bacterium]
MSIKNPVLFSTGSLYLEEVTTCFELAAQAGFDGMEILIDNRWTTRNPVKLNRLSQAHHLPIMAVHNPFFTNIPDWPSSSRPMEILQASVNLAKQVGAQVVVLHLPARIGGRVMIVPGRTFVRPRLKNPDHALAKAIQNGLLKRMETASGVKICVENMPQRNVLWWKSLYRWNTPARWQQVHDTLTFDSTHWGTWNMEPVDVFQQVKDQVRHIHLSNFNGKEHQLPMEGRLHLDRLLQAVAQTEQTISVTLEVEPNALHYKEESRRAEALQASLAFIRKHLNGKR